jgi:hypothetical protein
MKNIILIVTVLILIGNQENSGQNSSFKGKFVDFETGKVMPGVTMTYYAQSGKDYKGYNEGNGTFELKTGAESGDLVIQFLGYYSIKLVNIPNGIKQIDFGEIKIVKNFGLPESYMDGSLAELTKEQIEKDKRMRKDVLENYHIQVFGENIKPYFEGNYLVFDFSGLKIIQEK